MKVGPGWLVISIVYALDRLATPLGTQQGGGIRQVLQRLY